MLPRILSTYIRNYDDNDSFVLDPQCQYGNLCIIVPLHSTTSDCKLFSRYASTFVRDRYIENEGARILCARSESAAVAWKSYSESGILLIIGTDVDGYKDR